MNARQALLKLCRDRPGLVLSDLFWQVIRSGLPLLPGLIVAAVLNKLSEQPGVSKAVLFLCAALAGAGIARVMALLNSVALDARVEGAVKTVLVRNVMRSILSKPGAVPMSQPNGDIIGRLSADTEAIAQLLSFTFMVFGSFVQASVAVALMLAIDAEVTLTLIVPLIAVGLVMNLGSRRIQQLHQSNRVADGAVASFLGEIFGSAQAIQLASAQNSVLSQFRRLNAERRGFTLRSRFFTEVFLRSVWVNSANLAIGVVLLMTASRMANGTFSVGHLALFIAYLGWISDFTSLFVRNFTYYRQSKIALERLIDVMPVDDDLQTLVSSADQDRWPTPDPGGSLTSLNVRDLNYRHPSSGAGIHDVSFEIRAGEFVAITGRIGAGKSTLIRAVLGLLSADSGTVEWNGQDVGEPHMFFRAPVAAYVPQTPHLQSDSVLNNICLGIPPNVSTVEAAIHAAVLERDLATLSHGLDTQVGPRGMRLSGGQVQRVAAARALIRAPQLLVFDDVSSALDVETERLFWRRLALAGHTCLVVTQRDDVLASADRVIVLNGGRVVAMDDPRGVSGTRN